MKKILAILAAAVMLAAAPAFAETEGSALFDQMEGLTFEFSSGAGAWSTELNMSAGGLFTGNYHDSEMGETGKDYPDGTVYGCVFHGQLTNPVMEDEYTWKAGISVETDEGQVPEKTEDGIRFVTAPPYGVEKAQSVTVFLPGMPVERLPEGFAPWSHLQETDPDAEVLPYYAIWSEADEAGFISISGAVTGEDAGAAEEEKADDSLEVSGEITDGCYVLTVRADETGEWRADEMAQDDSVVRLAEAGTQDGVFTARYEPTGDGEVAVGLRHYNEYRVCDKMHTFDLLVKDGKVQEVTGGSFTASPDEGDLDPQFSGKWLETETQITALNVMKNPEGGWDVEISSPLTHGAWVIRGRAYYDCDYNALIYADGTQYDLIPGEETQEREAEAGLWGTLQLCPAGDDLQLSWYQTGRSAEEGTVTFERAPGLPAYTYTGEDPIEGAAANALAADPRVEDYLTEPGYVSIPCPIIHKTEMTDETHARVYGSFWILNYTEKDGILHNISGGEHAAIMTMEKSGDEWRITATEEAGDGDDYAADIMRFADGDSELAEKYFAGADLMSEANQEIRTRFIRAYVKANGLEITAYQDYGWDPVPLN